MNRWNSLTFVSLGYIYTLWGTYISHLGKRKKHLQKSTFGWGDVSSQQSNHSLNSQPKHQLTPRGELSLKQLPPPTPQTLHPAWWLLSPCVLGHFWQGSEITISGVSGDRAGVDSSNSRGMMEIYRNATHIEPQRPKHISDSGRLVCPKCGSRLCQNVKIRWFKTWDI